VEEIAKKFYSYGFGMGEEVEEIARKFYFNDFYFYFFVCCG